MGLDRKRLLKPLKTVRKLVRRLDREPAPEDVHDLRTSARRSEAILKALSLDEHGVGKSVMKDLRRCRRRAGKVRDMDVLTGYASTVHVTGEEDCAVELLESLGARRQKYAAKLYAEVRRVRSGLRKDLKQISAVIAHLVETRGGQPDHDAVGPNATGSAVTLAVRLAEPARLNRENLHPYRLKVKQLRNVLHMARGGNSFADDLARTKDAIGEWHDWQELAAIAEKELDHRSSCGLVRELKRISHSRYDQALQAAEALRGKYLARADSAKSFGTLRPAVWEAIARLAA